MTVLAMPLACLLVLRPTTVPAQQIWSAMDLVFGLAEAVVLHVLPIPRVSRMRRLCLSASVNAVFLVLLSRPLTVVRPYHVQWGVKVLVQERTAFVLLVTSGPDTFSPTARMPTALMDALLAQTHRESLSRKQVRHAGATLEEPARFNPGFRRAEVPRLP